ncbi:hypothetical protein P8625_04635 [Tenacibaculum tangerinum]|uniref:Uncharacterized protein n=1 Tax=Tenacibaculum tangerinum TaxID=3038772 RepID=A0ABY8L4U6_9FLAO|nr:hypothetical protein [Tenacibaculum tangerinum]WGH76451.1 hypothetical protein P8625_04635 [Tenacibaculum tangerinum]
MKKEELYSKLLFIREELNKGKSEHYLVKCKNEHLKKFTKNLYEYHLNETVLNKYTLPNFEEEVKVDRNKTYRKFLFMLEEEELCNSHHKFDKTKIEDFLVVLGQRLTSASARSEEAIPPLDSDLLIASFQSYNTQISKAARALEKHSERSTQNFWGIVKGKPKEKEEKVREILNYIFKNKTWWNVYCHFQHELVYEIRIPSGHGIRWKMKNFDFIGFVEPF